MYKWVTSTEIDRWAKTRNSEDKLPQLIDNIITAINDFSNIDFITFPANDDVRLQGFDGILNLKYKNVFFPKGLSLWEISVNKKTEKKIYDDFIKRTKDSQGYNTLTCTFIFTTARKLSKKTIINNNLLKSNNRKRKYKWRDIKIFDAINLEKWLSLTPAVASWFSREVLNKHSEYIFSLDRIWYEWVFKYKEMICSLLLEKRDDEIKALEKWLLSEEKVQSDTMNFFIKANSKDEVIAFLCAVLEKLDKKMRNYYFSKIIITSRIEDFRNMSELKAPHLIIPNFDTDNFGPFWYANKNKHRVIAPIIDNNHQENITLKNQDFLTVKKIFDKYLKEINIDNLFNNTNGDVFKIYQKLI